MENDKLELIVKPTQSGKTFIMLQEIAKMLEQNDNNIHIIFCDNQLLQTEQTSDRINKYDNLDTYITDEGDVSLILSSKSKIKHYTQLTHYIIIYKLRTIIACSNKKRLENINEIIEGFRSNEKFEYKFCIWIDEIDKNIKLFKKFLIKWNEYSQIIRIGLITATPKTVLETFDNIKIFELEYSHDKEVYHSFGESNFRLLNLYDIETEFYIEKILDIFSKDIENGQVWFIPGEVNTESHNNIKNILIKKKFIVIIINSRGKFLYKTNKNNKEEMIELYCESNKSICDFLGDLYISENYSKHKIAITGNLCINRGITINSDKMLITHAIFQPTINNSATGYQLAGRVCGNIKKFKNYKIPIIYCSIKFKEMIIKMEERAKNLAEKSFKLQNKIVSLFDYEKADIKIQNSGIPILLNLNKIDLLKIKSIKHISNKTRPIIEEIIKKYKLDNKNIDFDINKFKLKNKYLIDKTDVKDDGQSKYEYKNYILHYKNSLYKEPNINCKENEYLIYIITEDIQVWNATEGDSIILYKTDENIIND
jgi:hypothetical protein